MKAFQLLFMCLFLISCASKQDLIPLNYDKETFQKCPENGSCLLTVTSNQSLLIKKDITGVFYPKFIRSENVILKYEYTRKKIPNTEDSHYSEIVYLELSLNDLTTEVNYSNLKKVKALFGRLCFCRGQTGHYQIHDGVLSIKKLKDNIYTIQFRFSIDEVPQVIKSFEGVFVIE